MSKKRIINALVAVAIFASLSINATFDSEGIALAGNIFGYFLLVGILALVVDNHIKEVQQ